MFDSKSKRLQVEPSFYAETPLNNKIPRRLMMGDSYSLLRSSPKYYNELYLSLEDLSGAIQSKVKQLKVVRHFHGKKRDGIAYRNLHDEENFKTLFQSSRKTLKSIPMVGGINFSRNFALCMYFPKIKTLNFQRSWRGWTRPDSLQSVHKNPRSSGYFWSGSRFVENLELPCEYHSDLFVIKKIDGSKRFLSHLKKIELNIWCNNGFSNILMQLIKNQSFLRCITHLVIEDAWRITHGCLQPLLNYCTQLRSLSFSTGWRGLFGNPKPPLISKDFCLDLSCLQNLQVLKMDVKHFKAFIIGIDFPSSVRRIDLEIVDDNRSDNFQECFDFQCRENDEIIEDGDARDWESFEKYKMRNHFFAKWKKLNNLKVLNLTIYPFEKVDLLRDFVLPLLRATPQLEAFSFKTYLWRLNNSPGHERLFDLVMFFSEIESLKSLKHLELSTDTFAHCAFSGSLNSQKSLCLSNLSSVEIQTILYSDFDLKKFLKRFLCVNNLQSGATVINKNLVLRTFCVFSAQDFIRILTILHSVSCFKNLQLDLTINFVVEILDDICSNLTYPIYVAQNTQLRVNIYLKKFQEKEWTSEQEEYFKRIFGRIEFTVNEIEKYQWLNKELPFGFEIFRKNTKVISGEKRDWKGPLYYFENA